MTRTINIRGVDVEVVSDAKAETADWMVCMPWASEAYFDDDEAGVCAACYQPVRFRPSSPRTLPKICLPCMIAKVNSQ